MLHIYQIAKRWVSTSQTRQRKIRKLLKNIMSRVPNIAWSEFLISSIVFSWNSLCAWLLNWINNLEPSIRVIKLFLVELFCQLDACQAFGGKLCLWTAQWSSQTYSIGPRPPYWCERDKFPTRRETLVIGVVAAADSDNQSCYSSACLVPHKLALNRGGVVRIQNKLCYQKFAHLRRPSPETRLLCVLFFCH